MRTSKLHIFDHTKRVFDILTSAIALVLLLPVIAVTALAVAIKLGRPVLFRQERPGLRGHSFELVKFRTMLNVNERRGIVTNEQRITQFGSQLRAWSLDELPSLWNVLRGDMSLVGPRPLLVSYLSLYSPEQGRRHCVRPGLTGLAQINGRNALEWERRFELDVWYVDNRSWKLDLHVLVKTIEKVLRREGITSDGHVVGVPFERSTPSEEGGPS